MSVHSVRARTFAPSRRARAPRLGGAGEPRHLDLVLLATLAASAATAVLILVVRGLATLA